MPLSCPNCGEEYNLPPHKSKRIDVRMTAQLLDKINTYDEVIIVGGDQDFIPVIRILRRDKGKKVYIASFEEPLSSELVTEVDGINILDTHIDKIHKKIKPKTREVSLKEAERTTVPPHGNSYNYIFIINMYKYFSCKTHILLISYILTEYY